VAEEKDRLAAVAQAHEEAAAAEAAVRDVAGPPRHGHRGRRRLLDEEEEDKAPADGQGEARGLRVAVMGGGACDSFPFHLNCQYL